MNIKGNQIPGQSGMGCTRYNIHTYLYVYILLRSTYYYYLRIRIRLKVSNTYLYMEQYILARTAGITTRMAGPSSSIYCQYYYSCTGSTAVLAEGATKVPVL